MGKAPEIKWAVVLGVALGGFFDGILLHQILQWHHLLSLVPGFDDLRLQILWNGYFHALMYVVAAIGLWDLWRAHARAGEPRGRILAGALLIGFGIWHVLDAVLSHWVLGIHRIKLDSSDPLAWDLIWLVVFGLVPLAAGWLIGRGGGPGRLRGATVAMTLLTAATVGAGAWSLVPPPGQSFTAVVFRPGYGAPQVFAALASADARLVWSDPAMGVVVADVPPDRRWRLYRHGALLVTGSGVAAGCLAWSRR